jgi:hypothetical protein
MIMKSPGAGRSALVVVTTGAQTLEVTTIATSSTVRNVLTVVALGLMVPVGFGYLATGLVASGADLLGAYALFAMLLTAAVWLAVKRSWWVVAMPFVSVGFLVLMLWFGGRFLDWSG